MKCQTISLEYFFAAERRYILCTHRRGTLGVPSTARSTVKNWQIPKYHAKNGWNTEYCIYDRSRLLTAVSVSRVCLPQACRHQKSNSDIGRKREKTLIGRTIEMPGYWMPFQFLYRLCNHLPLSLTSRRTRAETLSTLACENIRFSSLFAAGVTQSALRNKGRPRAVYFFTCENNMIFSEIFTCKDIMFSRESSPGISLVFI